MIGSLAMIDGVTDPVANKLNNAHNGNDDDDDNNDIDPRWAKLKDLKP